MAARSYGQQSNQKDDPAMIAFRKKEAEQKKKDEEDIAAGKLLLDGSRRFIPMPNNLFMDIYSKSGNINKYYQDTIDKIYEAMKAHKKYYDDTMAECHYPVKDIIPNKKIIRDHIFTLDAFLFGWFALEVRNDKDNPNKKWMTECSIPLIRDFLEDVTNKKTPRILRGV